MMNNFGDLSYLDSNILVYAQQRKSPQHVVAKSLRDQCLNGEVAACISPQVLSEFFVTVTRTDGRAIDEPLSPAEATNEVRRYCESEQLVVIHPGPRIMERMLGLLQRYPVQGLRLHDLRHVATMLENNVTRVYTFNTRHFSSFSEIETLNPEAIDVPESQEPEEDAETEQNDI